MVHSSNLRFYDPIKLYTQKCVCKRALLDKKLVREKRQVPELRGLK